MLARVRVQVRRRAQALEHRGATLPGFPNLEVLREELERAILGRTLALLVFEGALARGRLEADATVATLGARLRSSFRVSGYFFRRPSSAAMKRATSS